jgi:hypothetical protein
MATPLHRAVVVQVPMSGGVPQLNLPAGSVTREGRIVHLDWNGYYATLRYLGMAGGNSVWVGSGSREIFTGLAHLGAGVKRLKDATSAEKTWLKNHTVQEHGDGTLLCPHVYLGDSPYVLGADDDGT